MALDGRWTQFQIDAEVEHYGVARIVDAHNAEVARHNSDILELTRLSTRLREMREALSELLNHVEHQNC